ncbi:POU domain class 2-associating factor 1 [Electrophorus electricus]|uniref:OCA domain-containing protein n=1 Tax=Electrophorus electricus TaxID=8005 RepID=A0A4W4E516_ELEEL|nr:POU domain class 2-associating factor 1 [Electrophorus electricus]
MGKSLSEQSASKPYQGVRVKDPVKELLRRKRGNTAKTAPPTAVVVPNNTLPSYAHVGSTGFPGTSPSGPSESPLEVGALCPGWVAQPSSSVSLPPLGHWAPTEYLHHHEPTVPGLSPLTTDMYVQPVCSSYTVVGAPSVFTLTPTPLFTNLGTISPPGTAMPQVDIPDSSLTYIPWAQPLPTLSAPGLQRGPCPQALPLPQLMPIPLPMSMHAPVPGPQQEEPSPAAEGSLALEKLLEEEEGKGDYVCSASLFTQDI